MEWVGYDPMTAKYVGFAVALAQQTYIEVSDGVSKSWGFSPGDMFSNMAGSIYPLAQATFPELQHFNLKLSYLPSIQYKDHEVADYVDDYEGFTIWMSVDVHHYLPESVKGYWPDFLNLALGTGIRNYLGEGPIQHTVYLALDLNMLKLPGNGSILNGMKKALNYFHLPMPAIMIAPKFAGFAFYF